MDRLTKKVGDNYCSQNGDFYDLYNKLGKLEDLEEQIGCSLEILFRALKEGIYVCNLSYRINVSLHYDKDLGFYFRWLDDGYFLKNYKISWWLKEDKSE